MNLLNPFQINDWEIQKFVRVILAMQIAIIGLITMDYIGIKIPLLRELFSLIYILFIPGILILRVLKIHELGNIETLLYSIGLSISSIMGIGLIINMLYPFFGIIKPISLIYLIITLFIFVTILVILSYIRDKEFSRSDYINLELSPKIGFIYLIPFLSIFGTYLMNYYQNNILLMIMILAIICTVIFVAFDKIDENKYPIIVFIISIALLLHTSLISEYIWGWDIHHEYYLANLVMENSFWDLNIPYNTNAMLSIVILTPTIAKITNISLVWVFKIVYPFIFSFVPVGLFLVFKKQSNSKIGFLSTFFFMSIFTFFIELNQLARQQIAELFLVLILLILINNSIKKINRTILTIIFAISLIVSHYGLSYIFMLNLIGVYTIIFIKDNLSSNKIFNFKHIILENKINLTFVLLFITISIAWYIYASNSSSFINIVKIGNQIFGSITTDFLNPDSSQGLAALDAKVISGIRNIPKYLNLFFQLFIVLGFLTTVYNIKITKFKTEYILFGMMNLILLVLSILMPYLASSLNITRIYHVSLLFLAPFAFIGGIEFFRIICRLFKVSWKKKYINNSLKILSILSVVLFLFYTGFVYEITNDNPTSFSISKIDYPITNNQEVIGMGWLYKEKKNGLVYADEYRSNLALSFGPISEIQINPNKTSTSYIFLGTYNLDSGFMLIPEKIKATKNQSYVKYDLLIKNENEIYNNGNTEIFW